MANWTATPREILAEPKGALPVPEESLITAEVNDPTVLPYGKPEDSPARVSYLKAIQGGYLEEIKAFCAFMDVPFQPFAKVALSAARVVKGEPP
jgi:hypothetical protein